MSTVAALIAALEKLSPEAPVGICLDGKKVYEVLNMFRCDKTGTIILAGPRVKPTLRLVR
jgi:hypothetical protein